MSEARVLRQIYQLLKTMNIWYTRITNISPCRHKNPHRKPGVADIMFFYAFTIGFFEAKDPEDGELSDDQKEFAAQCDKCNTPYYVIEKIENAEKALKEIARR